MAHLRIAIGQIMVVLINKINILLYLEASFLDIYVLVQFNYLNTIRLIVMSSFLCVATSARTYLQLL